MQRHRPRARRRRRSRTRPAWPQCRARARLAARLPQSPWGRRPSCPADSRGRERGLDLELSRSVASLAQISAAIEARDPYSRGHASRVTVFAKAMAKAIGLDRERLSVLRLGALLHDVGKLT